MERRANQRFRIDQIIQLSLSKEQVITALGIDISHGGILCESKAEIRPRMRVFLKINLGSEEEVDQITVDGVVVHVSPERDHTRFGIRFTVIPPESEEKLRAYLLRRREF